MNHFSAFSADWLRLREPIDHAARETAAAAMGPAGLEALRGARRAATAASPLRVVDLGCGTGAALRHLAPRLGGAQHWQVWDHDEALLRAWPATLHEWARHEGHRVQAGEGTHERPIRIEGTGFTATVERHAADLAHGLHTLPLAEADLLCASALLDLVSLSWLEALIARMRGTKARLCFALVIDGCIEWDPRLAGDAHIAAAFAEHQRRDKGFGPALGAMAPSTARRLLAEAGYAVQEARSDWVLRGGVLQGALIEGMAAAVLEQVPGSAVTTAAWQRARTAALAHTTVRIGHVDLVAAPLARG